MLLATVAPLEAAENTGVVDIRRGNGFARLVFSFDRPTDASAQSISTIFVLKFKKPVAVDLGSVAAKLPNIVTIARRDPDGFGMRFAMTRDYRVNVMRAGRYLVVDFLSKSWRGPPPGMPQDIVDKLARAAEAARRAAEELARQKAMQFQKLRVDIHQARQPTFNRISFNWNRFVTAQTTRKGDEVSILFGGAAKPDLAHLRINPPKNMVYVHHELGKDTLRITMKVTKGTKVRAFREGKNYVVDLVNKRPVKLTRIEENLYAAAQGKGAKSAPKIPRTEEMILPAADEPSPARKKVSVAPVSPPTPTVLPVGSKQKKRPETGANDMQPPVPERSQQKKSEMPVVIQSRGVRKSSLQEQKPVQKVEHLPRQAQLSRTSKLARLSKMPRPSKQALPGENLPGTLQIKGDANPAKRVNEKVLKDRQPVKPGVARGSFQTVESKPGKHNSKKRAVGNKIDITRTENNVQLHFPFQKSKVSAAIFQRNKFLWVLIDSDRKLDLAGLEAQLGGIVTGIRSEKLDRAQLFEFELSGPWLSSVSQRSTNWKISIGDLVTGSSKKYTPVKQKNASGEEEVFIPTGPIGRLHQIKDIHSGDDLMVITSPSPAKSIKKLHEHVEFQLFKTIHGIVVRPLSDTLRVLKNREGVKIIGSNGLYLSGNLQIAPEILEKPGNKRRKQARKLQFGDAGGEGLAGFVKKTLELERRISSSSGRMQSRLRLKLAQHWLSRGFGPEGLGNLDIVASSNAEVISDPVFRLMRGIARVMLQRYKEAKTDLETNDLENNPHASLWRAIAAYKLKNYDRAIAEMKRGEPAINSYMPRQQAMFRLAGADTAIEQGDRIYAGYELDNIPDKGITNMQRAMARFLEARLMELQNKPREALRLYADATRANIRPVTARAVFHLTDLRLRIGAINSAIGAGILERLSLVWRGDDVELQVLHRLADLYLEKGRFDDAFSLMETAVRAYPKSKQALALQDRMKAQFEQLYLQGKADKLPPIKALALFYDHKRLTPPGRLGDEMIRRLADRLINVDLLDKAASLLEYQVTRRLKGVGRAQVAIRLAMIHLLQHHPKKALKTLYRTRQPKLPKQVKQARRLLEARAYAELGRSGPVMELLGDDNSAEGGELIALALWNAKKWTKAGEQYEKVLGDRWQSNKLLSSKASGQVLRAAISYTLGGDRLGVGRLRDKYAAKMAKGADAKAFAMIINPLKTNAQAVDRLASDIADIDTLEGFVKAFRQRLKQTDSPLTTSAVQ